MSYFKYIIYFLLSVSDALINLSCSVFRYYPAVDISSMFLSKVELRRVNKLIGERQEDKKKLSDDTLGQIEEILYGKDLPKREELGQTQTKKKI